jgi:hypothetical protein
VEQIDELVASSWRRRRLIVEARVALEALIGDGYSDREGLCSRVVAELRRMERGMLT